MNKEPIDVPSSAVLVREQPQGVQRFDAQARRDAVEAMLNRQAMVLEVMDKVMKEGTHYGKIPGCGDKPALFKSGAEKLAMVFRLTPSFTIKQIDHDKGHREYEVVCMLSDGTQGVGVCSTMEGKYRFRGSAKKLTDKPVPNTYWDLRKSDPAKAQAMLGGKGFGTAKNENGVWFITEPTEDKVENDNPADVYNTVLKMAKKRAQVDATLTATGTSDLLTQDIEEMVEAANAASAENSNGAQAEKKEPEEKKPKRQSAPPSSQTPSVKTPPASTVNQKTDVSQLPEDEYKKVLAYLDSGKAKFLKLINDDEVTLPFAWKWAVDKGKILPTEPLGAISPIALFPSCSLSVSIPANRPAMKADFDQAIKEIAAIAKAGPLPEQDMWQLEAAYGNVKEEEEEPAWKSIPIPAWSKHVKEGGYKTFGDLPKNLLWWWCVQFVPTGFNGQPPSEADVKLRAILDTVRDNYDFESKEDAGSAPGSAEPEDNVPF